MFDLNRIEMVLKMHPHASAVTAIVFSPDGQQKQCLVDNLSLRLVFS